MAIHSTERPRLVNLETSEETERIAKLMSLAGEVYLKAYPEINLNLDPLGQLLPLPMDNGEILIITDRHLVMGDFSREGYSITTWKKGKSQKTLECDGAVLGERFFGPATPFRYSYSKSHNIDSNWLNKVEKALDGLNTNLNKR